MEKRNRKKSLSKDTEQKIKCMKRKEESPMKALRIEHSGKMNIAKEMEDEAQNVHN